MKLVNSSQLTVHRKRKSVNREPRTENRTGQVLIIGIIFLAVILIISAALFSRVTEFLRFGSNSLIREQATQLAEAGVDYVVWYLNANAGANPPAGAEIALGSVGSFKYTVANKGSNQNIKIVTGTGYVPNATSPKAKRTVKVEVFIDSEGAGFHYAVQAGDGGVEMSQSATINGNVYSNGSIIKGPGNQQLIDGDAYAVGLIDDGITVTGEPVEGAEPVDLPNIDNIVTEGKEAAEQGGITDCAVNPNLCTISIDDELGPQKYINGDLTIRNNAYVTMLGSIHIANGDLIMEGGNTTIKLDNSFGSNGVAIIVNGQVDLSQGGKFEPTDSTPKGYVLVISESTNPTEAVTLSQSGATAIFYALGGGGKLTQTASVASLAARTLTMANSATLNYESGLADARFSTGPGAAWIIKKGTYRFTSSP